MTAEQRHAIKQAIDAAARARIQAVRTRDPGSYCKGCGIHHTETNPGCTHCKDRERRRTRRLEKAEPCANPMCRNTIIRETKRDWPPHSGYCSPCYNARRYTGPRIKETA